MARPATTYWDYIQVERLLELQGGLDHDERGLANDEVLFITVHQVFELWFKLIHRELRSGDTVEVLTSSAQRPSRDWLHFVKTSKARSIVRRTIRAEEHASSVALGKDILEKEYRRNRVRKPDDEVLEEAARRFGMGGEEDLLAAFDRSGVSGARFAKQAGIKYQTFAN